MHISKNKNSDCKYPSFSLYENKNPKNPNHLSKKVPFWEKTSLNSRRTPLFSVKNTENKKPQSFD
jgi:hypothetical protein